MIVKLSPRHPLIYSAVFLITTIVTLITFQDNADALCIQPPEEGNWVNTDSNTRSLTQINLRFVCQDQILNGQPYPPGPAWYDHIYGKCHPTDCNWGEVGARRLDTDHIYAIYSQGFATRYVYAKMSQYRPGQLWVYTWTNFTDPGRPDYGSHNWFRQE